MVPGGKKFELGVKLPSSMKYAKSSFYVKTKGSSSYKYYGASYAGSLVKPTTSALKKGGSFYVVVQYQKKSGNTLYKYNITSKAKSFKKNAKVASG